MTWAGLTKVDWVTHSEKVAALSRRKDETRRKIGMMARGSRRNSMLRSFSKKQLRVVADDILEWQDHIPALPFNRFY